MEEAYNNGNHKLSPGRLEPINHSALGQYSNGNQGSLINPTSRLDYTTIQNESQQFDDEMLKAKNPSSLLDRHFK